MAETSEADIRGDLGKVEISGPVAEGVRAAEGKDCKLQGVVDGDVSGHAGYESTVRKEKLAQILSSFRPSDRIVEILDEGIRRKCRNIETVNRCTKKSSKYPMTNVLSKLVNSLHVIGFDERAVAARACELCAPRCDIVVAWTIRSRSELFEKLQVCKGGGVDGCFCFVFHH